MFAWLVIIVCLPSIHYMVFIFRIHFIYICIILYPYLCALSNWYIQLDYLRISVLNSLIIITRIFKPDFRLVGSAATSQIKRHARKSLLTHDDVINGNIFRVSGLFVRGIHWSPVNSPHKGQWLGALIFSLICAWINGLVKNCEAGNLRRHRAHYDVIVMLHRFQHKLSS